MAVPAMAFDTEAMLCTVWGVMGRRTSPGRPTAEAIALGKGQLILVDDTDRQPGQVVLLDQGCSLSVDLLEKSIVPAGRRWLCRCGRHGRCPRAGKQAGRRCSRKNQESATRKTFHSVTSCVELGAQYKKQGDGTVRLWGGEEGCCRKAVRTSQLYRLTTLQRILMSLYASLSSRAPLVIDRKSGRSLCRLSCTRAGILRSVLRPPVHPLAVPLPAGLRLFPGRAGEHQPVAVVPCPAVQHRNPYPHPEDFAFTWQWVCDTHPLMLE